MRITAFFLALAFVAAAVEAKTLRWSSQGDYLTADPHGQNEGINNLINDEIFERLTRRDKQLASSPGSPRRGAGESSNEGVVFHDGTPMPPTTWSSDRGRRCPAQLQGIRDPSGGATHRRLHGRDRDGAPVPAQCSSERDRCAQSRRGAVAWRHSPGLQERRGDLRLACRTAPGHAQKDSEVATVLKKFPSGASPTPLRGHVTTCTAIKSDATRMAALLARSTCARSSLQDLPRSSNRVM